MWQIDVAEFVLKVKLRASFSSAVSWRPVSSALRVEHLLSRRPCSSPHLPSASRQSPEHRSRPRQAQLRRRRAEPQWHLQRAPRRIHHPQQVQDPHFRQQTGSAYSGEVELPNLRSRTRRRWLRKSCLAHFRRNRRTRWRPGRYLKCHRPLQTGSPLRHQSSGLSLLQSQGSEPEFQTASKRDWKTQQLKHSHRK